MDTNSHRTTRLWLGAIRRQWLMLIFMVGPLVGVGLVAMIFGLPFDMKLLAGGMTVFAGGLVLILLRGDMRVSRSRKG